MMNSFLNNIREKIKYLRTFFSTEKISNFIFNNKKTIIATVIFLNLFALSSFFLQFGFSVDYLDFFSKDNPKLVEYNRMNDLYDTGESIIMLIEADDSLLAEKHLYDVLELQENIKNIDGILYLQGYLPNEIRNGSHVLKVNKKFISRHANDKSDEKNDKLLQNYIRKRKGAQLSNDETTGILTIMLEANADPFITVKALEEQLISKSGLNLSLSGNLIVQRVMKRYFMVIIMLLPPAAIFLIISIFYIALRSRLLAIFALIPAGISALWMLGTILWSGQELTMLTVISPIFIVTMGSANGLHFISHFKDAFQKLNNYQEALTATYKEVTIPIILTTLTTVAGFMSLAWTDLVAMQQMAIFVSLGILYAGILALIFLPALLLTTKPNIPPSSKQGKQKILTFVMSWCFKQKKSVIIAFSALTIISVLFMTQISVVSDQMAFFKDDSQIAISAETIKDKFGGSVPFIAEVDAPRGLLSLANNEYRDDILDIERDLERMPGIQSAISLFDITDQATNIPNEQPFSKNVLIKNALYMFEREYGEKNLLSWYTKDSVKLLLKTEDYDDINFKQLESYVKETPEIRALTGLPIIFNELSRLIVWSQISSLGLAFFLIFFMLYIVFRSTRTASAALVPIAITITAIMGMLSVTGFGINIATAMLSAIAVGVGVDYAIHLVSAISFYKKKGLSESEASKKAVASTSVPILANAFGLAIGLSVFYFSPLKIHSEIASVMWVAMVLSSTSALLLIPLFFVKEK